MDNLDFNRDSVANACDLLQAIGLRRKHFGETAETPDQVLGDRLHIAAPQGARQHKLQKLVIIEAVYPRANETGAQALAMPGGRISVRFRRSYRPLFRLG